MFRMTDPLRFVTFLSVFLVHFKTGDATRSFGIGAMLSSKNMETVFLDAVGDINASQNASFVLNASSSVLSSNPFRSALDVCENVISKGVYAVIVSEAADNASPPVSVSFACGFYRIPIIGIATRESVFSNKKIHHSFLRTVPPYSDQAHVWLGLLHHFDWRKVILLTSNDQDSRAIATKFTELAETGGNEIKIEKTIVFPTGTENATSHLKILLKTQSRVILFSASEQDAAVVFKNAADLKATGEGFAWLVTEQTLTGKARGGLPQGVLGIKLLHGDNEEAELKDAVRIAAKAFSRLNTTGRVVPPVTSCNKTGHWESGDAVFNELIKTNLTDGETGTVAFDSKGDRLNAMYQIVNLKASGDDNLTVVGEFTNNGYIKMESNVTWPGNQNTTPEGVFISNHLKVVTVAGEPFVFVRDVPANGKCESLDTDKKEHIKCTGQVFGEDIDEAAKNRREHCCYGFCIALLIKLGKTVNFTYSVHLAEDGSYGSLRRVNGSDRKRWNGMVGEVMDGNADLIVAALTINNERAEWIEFSKPFKYQGLTILVKKKENPNRLDSFLRPFQINLWLLVLLSVHVVAVILYLLDRFSPFGRFKLARKQQEETALNLSSAMWFSWGVLLNSGIGEGTPRSFSARVLGMVWAGFAMIIVASYTANLAAFLVLDRPKAVVSGLEDPRLRNPSDNFTYATVADSSVDAYFRGQVEMSSMYTFMEKYNVKTAKEAIEKVKRGELGAFIWDSPVLYYEASHDCYLTTAGELFSRSGYGIGMPKGSMWSNDISLAILNFHESGVMEELETDWIDTSKCEDESTSPATLGLQHMLGVFIMVAAGIGAGIVIILLEIVYHKHRGWKERQKEIAKKTTDKWRANIMFKKKDRAQPNGDLGTNGRSDGIARRNPIFAPEPLTESPFTYN